MTSLFQAICTKIHRFCNEILQEIDQNNQVFQGRFDHMDIGEHRSNSIVSEFSKKKMIDEKHVKNQDLMMMTYTIFFNQITQISK